MCFQERWETGLVIQTEDEAFSAGQAWEEAWKTKGKGKGNKILRKTWKSKIKKKKANNQLINHLEYSCFIGMLLFIYFTTPKSCILLFLLIKNGF